MNTSVADPRRPALLLPPPLPPGSTIGLVAPAGPVLDQEAFSSGVRLLHELGYATRFRRDLPGRSHGYLAAGDDERARDFNELWAAPDISAVLAVRGGYGSLRMVNGIDMALVRSHPKRFIGFSDITVLHAALFKHAGLVTFHGPVLTSLASADRDSIASFVDALSVATPFCLEARNIEVLRPGRASGPLLGGNLTNLVHLLGTVHELDWRGAILVLEDIGEAPYRIDRMLTHLQAAGRLEGLAGLILGSFRCNAGESDSNRRSNEEIVWARVLELFSNQPIPLWANFPVGHECCNRTLPLGASAEMDSNRPCLQIFFPMP